MATFGTRLRGLRVARSWSQEKLGFELEVTGATISKWENDRSEPNLHQLTLLRQLLASDNITLDWLIAGEGDSKAARSQKSDGDELMLLSRFRRLSSKKQKLLLGFLE
jgi:transcriptional regulator with XRE-family HTH domain